MLMQAVMVLSVGWLGRASAAGVALCLFQHATITTVTSLEAIMFWFAVRDVARAFTIAPLTTGVQNTSAPQVAAALPQQTMVTVAPAESH
jgi:hypothetical protein